MNTAQRFIGLFLKFLESQKDKPSKLTVKNYKADVSQFIRWYEAKYHEEFSADNISSFILNEYKLDRLNPKNEGKSVSVRSIERHFSSLRKFFNFLKLEGYVSRSPFDKTEAKNQKENDPFRIKDFKDYLYVYNASHLTIKNYVIDVKQFLNWAEEVTGIKETWDVSEKDLFQKLDNSLIEEYKKRLISQSFSPLTINRKLSSLRRYTAWAASEGLVRDIKKEQVSNLEKLKTSRPIAIKETPNTKYQIPNTKYSSFPPLRLFQKIGKLSGIAFDLAITSHLASFGEKITYLNWKRKGKPIFTKIQDSRFKIQDHKSSIINPKSIDNIRKELYAPLSVSIASYPWHRKVIHHAKYTRPEWYKKYHSYSIVHYFNLAILVIFMAGLGFGIYNAFFIEPKLKQPVLAALPTAPPRILSFQGRLTDDNDNPIESLTALRFGIYDDEVASGAALLWQEIDSVDPDTDGIFNIYLGQNTAIPATLFTENASLWLGVTVETTPELEPRQRIATVAYAANAETLQGLLPITDPSATQENVVLALDSSGNLTIGGSATPVFQATGGEFTISGNVLALTTVAGTNSNVEISPDGTGVIDLQKPLQNTTNNNNISTAIGAVEIDDLLAILASSSGQSALTINQTSTGPLISASTSGTAKFTVDNDGTVSSGNLLSLTPDTYNIGSTDNYWNNLYVNNIISGGVALTQYWQRNLGAMSPVNLTDALNIGSTSSSSAYFHVPGTNNENAWFNLGTGNLGIGNTNPEAKLEIEGGIIIDNGYTFQVGGGSDGGDEILRIGNSGGKAYIQTFANRDIKMGSNTYTDAIFIEGTNGNVGIGGTTGPDAKLDVLAGAGGTQLRLTSTDGSVYSNIKTDQLGYLSFTPTGLIATMGGTFNPSVDSTYNLGSTDAYWDTIYVNNLVGTTVASNEWQRVLGALSPRNITDDLLLGSSATSSALFSVTGIANNQVTASVSGNLIVMPTNGWGGNVGIGTISPTQALDVYPSTINKGARIGYAAIGDGGAFSEGHGSNNYYAYFSNTTMATYANRNGFALLQKDDGTTYLNTAASKNLYFGVNNSTKMILNSNGNLGVGDLTPISKLSVSGNTGSNGLVTFNQTGTGDIFSASASGATKFIINNSGNVGIGTTGPDARLDVLSAAGGTQLRLTSTDGSVYSDIKVDQLGYLSFAPTGLIATMGGTFNPSVDSTYNLGSTDRKWDTLYVNNIEGVSLGSTGYWTQSELDGTLYPNNPTVDLLVGGQSTVSAKFAVLNLNSGQATASVSGNLIVMPTNGWGGNVGIGTINPNEKLELSATDVGLLLNGGANWSTGSQYLKFARGGSTTWTIGQDQDSTNNLYFAYSDGFTSPKLTITNNGDVGIGTTSPLEELDVIGNASVSGTMAVNTIKAPTGALNLQYKSGPNTWTNALTIADNTGYVGIGTTSPDGVFVAQKTLAGQDALFRLRNFSTDANSTATLMLQATTVNTYSGGGLRYDRTNTRLEFSADTSSSWVANMAIQGGNVGIGTTSPTAKLDIAGDASTSGSLVFRGSSPSTIDVLNGNRLDFQTSVGGDSGLSAKMTILNNGNVGIGTTNPYTPLHVVGTIRLADGGDPTNYFTISPNSLAFARNSTNYISYDATNNADLRIIRNNEYNIPVIEFTKDGNVGIGTTGPDAKLDVLSGAGGTQLRLTSTDGSVYSDIKTDQLGYLSLSPTGLIATMGGTFNPSTDSTYDLGSEGAYWDTLYVNNIEGVSLGSTGYWTQSDGALYPNNSTVDLLIGGQATSSAKFAVLNLNSGQATASVSGNLIVMPDNGWGGNVGIGTISPGYNLHIQNTADAAIYLEADIDNATESDNPFLKLTQDNGGTSGIIGFSGTNDYDPENNAYSDAKSDALLIGTISDDYLQFGTNDAVSMTINDGYVGIGVVDAAGRLEVRGAGPNTSTVILDSYFANGIAIRPNKSSGGWAYGYGFINNAADTVWANYGGFGSGDAMSYLYIGEAWDDHAVRFYPSTNVSSFRGDVGIGISDPDAHLQIGLASTDSETAPTSINAAAYYLGLGGQEWGANSYRLMGMGYKDGSTTHFPGYIGYQEISTISGNTYGDLIFGTRNVVTDTAPTERMRINYNGNVGIGTTDPNSRLDVQGETVGKALVNLNYTGTDQNILTASTSGTTKFYLTNAGVLYGASFYDIDNSSYFLDPAATGTSLTTYGSVGIGTASPLTSTGLHVSKNSLGNAAVIIDQLSSASGADLLVASNSGTTQFRVASDGDVYVGPNGTGKLTAATIDPLYTIDGGKYSTYGTSMVGVKEEVTGKASLSYNALDEAYSYTIDLNNQEVASDLWLFSRVTDPNIALTSILLTPDSSSRVWYKKDVDNRKITFLSDSPTSLSFRLTAPRFDHMSWGNISDETDPNITGLVVPGAEDLINEKLEDATMSGSPIYSEFSIAKTFSEFGEPIYALIDSLGNSIKRTGGFSTLIAANLQAGALSASEIATESLSIGGQTIQEYIASSIENILNNNYLISGDEISSPIASIDTLKTGIISPLASDSTVELALGNSSLEVRNSETKEVVARIDDSGNVYTEGDLTARSASFAGTLRAKNIIAENIEGLNISSSTISAQYITNNYYESTGAGELATIPVSSDYMDISSMSGQFIYVDKLQTKLATFTQGLMSFGPTSLSDTSIAGQLAVGGNLILADGAINVLGADLEIQPLRQGGISFLSGLVKIDESGNLAVLGNATFAKDVTVGGKLATGIISPIANNDLAIVNASDSAVLSVSQKGDIIASGSGTFGKLNLNFVKEALALSDNEILATGSAGIATISARQKEITINNDLITKDSLIYITPIGSVNGLNPYLLRQVPEDQELNGIEGSFTIGIDEFTTKPIPFNWLIIN